MADYEYDIFLSYHRADEDWTRWATETVASTLATLLGQAIDRPKIFTDTTIDTGTAWPRKLARAHARSRVLVALLSRNYFKSPWCRLELALMCEREKQCNVLSPANQVALIVPFVLDDGDCFPPEVQEMQLKGIHAYATPFWGELAPIFLTSRKS